jgi:hypothetical protein
MRVCRPRVEAAFYRTFYPDRMTPEQLFLHTLEDLDSRLELRKGEYDALMMAWLLRKLLLGGEQCLLAILERGRTGRGSDWTDPIFEVRPTAIPDRLVGHLAIAPEPGDVVDRLSRADS